MDIVLVHGSYHGAWCWEPLIPELEQLGHRPIAVDLPISDPKLGADAYADAVVAAAAELPDPLVVGHSMAGVVVPLVAERRPVAGLVFLASLLPEPGRSVNEQRATEPIDGRFQPTTAEWTDLGDDVWLIGPTTAREIFFHDAADEVASWAVARLRPQSYRVMNEPSPLGRWPDVPRAYVVCADDHATNPAWGRGAARDRLGVEPIEIAGGHSPFLTRPAELAAIIDRIAADNA